MATLSEEFTDYRSRKNEGTGSHENKVLSRLSNPDIRAFGAHALFARAETGGNTGQAYGVFAPAHVTGTAVILPYSRQAARHPDPLIEYAKNKEANGCK
jgi:hypothetical protein